jgi:hypothetical protein
MDKLRTAAQMVSDVDTQLYDATEGVEERLVRAKEHDERNHILDLTEV